MAPSTVSSVPGDLSSMLSRLLSTLDSSATRLSAILSTSTGVDKFMLTIYYTLKLLYPQITRVRDLRMRAAVSATPLAKTSPALVPGQAVAAVQLASPIDSWLVATDTSMRLTAAMVSEFRMISRLWGMLTMYRWAKGTYLAPPPDSPIVWGQIAACSAYQVLENVAYLAGKGIIRGDWVSPERQGKMWVLSCRFWLVHTALEAWRLLRERQRAKKTAATGEKEDKIRTKEAKKAWNRAWYINAGYAPMALHYSIPTGLISDDALGVLGLIVAYNSFGHMWRQAA